MATRITAQDVLDGTLTDADVAAANKDGASSTASMRTLGTGAAQAAAGNDSRLSDSRAPTGSAGGDLTGTYPNPTLGSGAFATPAIVLGSSAAAGATSDAIRSDSTIAAFDATNPSTQAFGDAAAVGSAAFAARRDHKHAMPSLPIGANELIYRYTVTGSDKASIDTGADTADAGSNDWTNGDVLQVWIIARTDEAAAVSNLNVTVNNDTGSTYDFINMQLNNTSVTGSNTRGTTAWQTLTHGSGGDASYPAVTRLTIPGYAGTVFFKVAEVLEGQAESAAANCFVRARSHGWRSTAAITRMKIAAAGAAKLKVGSQLLIYKRRNA